LRSVSVGVGAGDVDDVCRCKIIPAFSIETNVEKDVPVVSVASLFGTGKGNGDDLLDGLAAEGAGARGDEDVDGAGVAEAAVVTAA